MMKNKNEIGNLFKRLHDIGQNETEKQWLAMSLENELFVKEFEALKKQQNEGKNNESL